MSTKCLKSFRQKGSGECCSAQVRGGRAQDLGRDRDGHQTAGAGTGPAMPGVESGQRRAVG
jgi:hypothetical protein